MTKPYKTRFNDKGRIAKHYSQFQSALDYHEEHSKNAVLATFTSDPETTDDPARLTLALTGHRQLKRCG
jgi:hypothetical protein